MRFAYVYRCDDAKDDIEECDGPKQEQSNDGTGFFNSAARRISAFSGGT